MDETSEEKGTLMTQLNGKPLCREAAIEVRDAGRRRPLVLELYGGYLTMRLKGTRRRYSLDFQSMYSLAVKKAVAEARTERRKR